MRFRGEGSLGDSSCRLLMVQLFRGNSRLESLILSHYSRFTCERNTEKIIDEDDDEGRPEGPGCKGLRSARCVDFSVVFQLSAS